MSKFQYVARGDLELQNQIFTDSKPAGTDGVKLRRAIAASGLISPPAARRVDAGLVATSASQCKLLSLGRRVQSIVFVAGIKNALGAKSPGGLEHFLRVRPSLRQR
jgi:hypothetical protein